MASMSGDKAWAHRIAKRVEAGEVIDRYAVNAASEVLGRPILRGGKHAVRPDAKDRQAGDLHSHSRDEMVPI